SCPPPLVIDSVGFIPALKTMVSEPRSALAAMIASLKLQSPTAHPLGAGSSALVTVNVLPAIGMKTEGAPLPLLIVTKPGRVSTLTLIGNTAVTSLSKSTEKEGRSADFDAS